MPHGVTIATPGLQALILCGPGSSFPTFTANPDENPKALLPIANRPMVWYALDLCYRAGITDITLVCPPSAAEAIKAALGTNPFLTSLPYPSPDLLAPKDLDQNTGTAEILRLPELQSLVKSDFLVLPCDLVCELGPDKLLQAWMVKAASLPDLLGGTRSPEALRSGGLGVWYETKTATPIKGEETDYVATASLPPSSVLPQQGSLFPHIREVVLSMPTDTLKDVLADEGKLSIRPSLFNKHPQVQHLVSHRDAHIYIFPRWIMDWVKENERLETIGEDVVGWWAKAGWQQGLSAKLGLDKVLGGESDSTTDAEDSKPASGSIASPNSETELSSSPSPPLATTTTAPVSVKDKSDQTIHDESSLPAHGVSSSAPSTNKANTIPPMLAYIHPSKGPDAANAPLIRRVDTAQLLLQTSLQLAKIPSVEEQPHNPSPFAHARKIAYPEGVKPRTTITRSDSLLAENVTVQEKTSIKECVVGANCTIMEGAKLSKCLLMEGAVVGRNCKLTGCVLGKRSEVGEGSTLTDCEVQENLLVEAKTEAKQEKFMSSSGLEATEEELEGLQLGDDDGSEEE